MLVPNSRCIVLSNTVSSRLVSLPAFQLKEELVQTIDRNQITVIAGATGCGKVSGTAVFMIGISFRKNTLILNIAFLCIF
jgi:HrpA-like RNA helicase